MWDSYSSADIPTTRTIEKPTLNNIVGLHHSIPYIIILISYWKYVTIMVGN